MNKLLLASSRAVFNMRQYCCSHHFHASRMETSIVEQLTVRGVLRLEASGMMPGL